MLGIFIIMDWFSFEFMSDAHFNNEGYIVPIKLKNGFDGFLQLMELNFDGSRINNISALG